jgi:hypothetical protein
VLSVTCCDPAIQATASAVQGDGEDYAGNPALRARLAADYENRVIYTERSSRDPGGVHMIIVGDASEGFRRARHIETRGA